MEFDGWIETMLAMNGKMRLGESMRFHGTQ